MNIWIDCEFNEFGGDLISMALVADDLSEESKVMVFAGKRNCQETMKALREECEKEFLQ